MVTVVLAVAAGGGCETTGVTTLTENRAAYEDARQFLRVGRTTKTDVLDKYDQPRQSLQFAELPQGERPAEVRDLADGEVWRYWRTDTVMIGTYTGTSLGVNEPRNIGPRGYQHTVMRKSRMELFFDPAGVLAHYRIWRDAP